MKDPDPKAALIVSGILWSPLVILALAAWAGL